MGPKPHLATGPHCAPLGRMSLLYPRESGDESPSKMAGSPDRFFSPALAPWQEKGVKEA
jgi:hypothetical protein